MTIESSLFHPDVLQTLYDSPEIFDTIAQFRGRELRLQKAMRARYDDHIVRAALILHDLRKRAQVKFSRGSEMWFDRTGLEQSTCETVANYKAKRFRGEVVDICSGIGGDSIAMAMNADVISIDRVAARSMCVQWNAAIYEVSDAIRVQSREATADDAQGRLVHIDPDRRAGQRGRSLRIDDLEPGPAFLRNLMKTSRGGAIKLSPASNFRGSFDDAEVELISSGGECKEATVWFGELKTDCTTRATCVATGETIAGHLSYDMAEVSQPLRYVFDPDPALVRSGLLDQFCFESGINRLDVEEEYLTSDERPDTAFLPGAFEISAQLPNDVKYLRKHLREANVGRVEIKARRVPTDVEKLRRSLKLKGDNGATVIVARLNGQSRILVGKRL